jgi:hypothetical protein
MQLSIRPAVFDDADSISVLLNETSNEFRPSNQTVISIAYLPLQSSPFLPAGAADKLYSLGIFS